jgi:AsmA protein
LPNGALDLGLGADIVANLFDQTVNVKGLSLDALGLVLSGNVDVANLDTEAAVSGQLASNEFSVLDLFSTLGIEAPVTADPDVLKKASLSLALSATPNSAALNDLTIKLDDTTFNGKASVPSLAGAIPPVRFDFGVDSIDLDRYLPPTADGDATDTDTASAAPATTGDEVIELPLEMMRQLDIDGVFKVGSVKIMNLTTNDIAVPLKAANGRITLDGVKASMYEGQLNSVMALDATGSEPAFAVDMDLAGIEADPLLADLMQKDSFLTGNGQFATNITTSGNTVNKLTAALNGGFNTAFNDGSINGVNIGYQIRRAKAALTGKSLPENAESVKTDFSALSVSGQFTNGVMQSDDLDLRSPLLRLGGAGQVDLPGEQVDYTLTTLITGTAEGQGGADLASLKGVKLDIPIQGSFDELAANFAGVILNGMKNNIANNIKGEAAARAKAEADKLKAQAQEQLKAKEAEARAKLEAEKAKAQERIQQEQAAAKEKAEAALQKGQDQVKDKLKGLFK